MAQRTIMRFERDDLLFWLSDLGMQWEDGDWQEHQRVLAAMLVC